MATPVLIIGKSGSGKSTSLRNCQNEHWNLIRVLNKPLPFKGKIDGWFTDDYQQVMKCLIASKAESIVIDDAGYLITNHFMRGHASAFSGRSMSTHKVDMLLPEKAMRYSLCTMILETIFGILSSLLSRKYLRTRLCT